MILVVGSCGYAGSAVLRQLEQSGCPCCGIDWKNLTDYRLWREKDLAAADAFVWLAGHSSVAACEADPEGSWDNNVGSFRHLLRAVGDRPFVFASSVSVYGDRRGDEASEGDPLPRSAELYDQQKKLAELLVRDHCPRGYVLRLGTLCGGNVSLRPELVVNSMVRSALAVGVVRVANPWKHRPLLHMAGLVAAVGRCLGGEAPAGVYNLADCSPSFGEMAAAVSRITGAGLAVCDADTPYNLRAVTTKAAGAGLIDPIHLEALVRRVKEDVCAS